MSTSNSKVNFIASSSGVVIENIAPLKTVSGPTTNLPGDEDIQPLSGCPFYHVIISKSHIYPAFSMPVSNELALPSAVVPAILKYGSKSWDIQYCGLGKSYNKFFNHRGWKKFAVDNHLEVGDACVFELKESSEEKLVFQVQILRGDLPETFLKRKEKEKEKKKARAKIAEKPGGKSAENRNSAEMPILID
ncbi:hypothetical protein HN51_004712 [Arachis hypogaea]|uniref:TF-B3 domain-containing protein n=2 Tax=Arachis TaxID=3817 RepID=A0A445DHD6_ARAHY|nr:B3 domain-containing protein Os06g0112300-like [Arachis duranensis]XP_025694982.1 B3 domain-containing protein Os06g0112300 [Arachis hypogaea]XP_025694983.1 B3 domain-containing protein Os06g0112300 [Arachis hypogaea]RYR62605.1 hypothetical protein Ahy_A04g020314 [Arachis hypogaea]